MRLAIFDFDGTIIRKNSWQEFFWFELTRRKDRAPLLFGALLLRKLGLMTGTSLRDVALHGLNGLSRTEVAAIGDRMYHERLAPELNQRALSEIQQRRENGHRIVVATGTFDFLVSPAAQALGLTEVVATSIAYENDTCLGRRHTPERLGQDKAAAVRRHFEHSAVDWDGSCVFTDSLIDDPLLHLVGSRNFVTIDGRIPAALPPGTVVHDWSAA